MVPLPVQADIFSDATMVAQQASERIVQAAQAAIRERGVFRLVLAGGTTPQRAYRLLAQTEQDWAHWQIFWGDERCLPATDPERNSLMAQQAWLSQVSIPAANIYPIPAELGAEVAATAYAQTLMGLLPFDLVLLGMGEDGHTASLFPNDPLLGKEPASLLVKAVHNAPKPPPERVSLVPYVLRRCRQQLVLVTGKGKREAVERWQAGEDLPIAQVVMEGAVLLGDWDAFGG